LAKTKCFYVRLKGRRYSPWHKIRIWNLNVYSAYRTRDRSPRPYWVVLRWQRRACNEF